MRYRNLCLPAFLLSVAGPACAGPPELPDWLQIKGFGTVGAARDDDDDAQFVRDLSQPDGLGHHWSGSVDSLLGLQADVRLSARTTLAVQGLTRYRYDGSWRPQLSLAFLRHDFSPSTTLRLGRMGTEFYLQGDARHIGYANTAIRPSADYFGPIVVSLFDGADVSYTGDTGYGLLRAKLFAGQAAEKAPFTRNHTWDLNGSRLAGAYLDYLNGPWQLRISHSRIRFRHELPINAAAAEAGIPFAMLTAAPELSIAGTHASYDALGLAYDEGALQLQAQFSRIRYETSAYEDTKAGYLLAAWRIGPVTPYLGYSWTRSHAAPLSTPTNPLVRAAIREFIVQTHSDQKTWSLGARWDFYRNLALKAQFDFIRADDGSHFPLRYTENDWDGSLNVFSLALDFVF